MKKTALKDLVSKHGELSRFDRGLNIQPSEVQKAVNSGRDITIIEYKNGKMVGSEARPFPAPKHAR